MLNDGNSINEKLLETLYNITDNITKDIIIEYPENSINAVNKLKTQLEKNFPSKTIILKKIITAQTSLYISNFFNNINLKAPQ